MIVPLPLSHFSSSALIVGFAAAFHFSKPFLPLASAFSPLPGFSLRAPLNAAHLASWLLRAYNFCRKPANRRAYAALLSDSPALKTRFWDIYEGHTFRIRR
ncbi:hypothetical protein OC861_006250 [Tilletia horrida]|nr:hypothetical protein OC861_006250 [Tilletia horrida]